MRFLRFFPLLTWGYISPAQILWLCRTIQRQDVHCLRLYKATKSKTFFLDFLSSFFSFSFSFFIYLYYFLPFFSCISSDVPLLSICISSTSKHTQPAWVDVSERFQSDLHWERYLRDLSETSQRRCLFCDVFKTSQKRCILCDVFKTSRAYLRKDVSETSQKHLWQVFLVFQKYVIKIILCDFREVIAISDKLDVGPSETLKKWKVLWAHCLDINQSGLPSGLISTWEFWQVKDRQNQIASVSFTTSSDFFRLIKLAMTCCHYELC